jgi:HTH-type transcriptional regulator/antitoxin HigA
MSMEIKPIKNKRDYRRVLKEIDGLMEARPNTPEGDRLDVLEPFIGSRARVAEVLNRKRSLTLPMIRRLHQGLGIPAEVLIGESVAA